LARADEKTHIYNKKIIRVVSGNTILCLHRGERAFVYEGIAVPTTGQIFSREAMEVNRRLVERGTVRIECSHSDLDASIRSKEGLPVPARVYLPRTGGEDVFVNLALVERGVAMPRDVSRAGNVPYREDLLDAMGRARKDSRGFWGTHPDLDSIENLIGNNVHNEARSRLQQFLDYFGTANIDEDLQRPLLVHMGRANLLWVEASRALGDLTAAEQRLADLLAVAPKSPGLWLPLGRYFKKLKMPERALTCYSSYRKVFPDSVEALREEANLAYEIMKWTVAYEAFQELEKVEVLTVEERRKMRQCPQMVERLTRHLGLAVEMQKADRLEEAINHLEEAFDIGGGNYKEIVELFESIRRRQSKAVSALCSEKYSEAKIAFDQGEITSALKNIEEALDLLGEPDMDSEAEASCRHKVDSLRRLCEELRRQWLAALDKNDEKTLKAYLESIPPPPREFGDLGEERLAVVGKENAAFTAAQKRDTISAWESFLKDYPNSRHVVVARRRIIDLTVADLLRKSYSPIPPISVNPDAVDSNDLTLTVRNNWKKNVVVVDFSGPESQRVVVDPQKNQTLKMAAGSYRIVARIYEPGYPVLGGQEKLVKSAYTMTFDEGPPPPPVQ